MNNAELLGLLLPPVSYDPNGPQIGAELMAQGAQLDKARDHAQLISGAITPFYAGDLLPDWERLLAITTNPNMTHQQRLAVVIAKLAETGGLSIPYFIRLAAALGYHITIHEPQPFRAGRGRAGDVVYPIEIVFVWEVSVQGSDVEVYHFRAGSSYAGERLIAFGNPVIEALFNELKPAHTYVIFKYPEA